MGDAASDPRTGEQKELREILKAQTEKINFMLQHFGSRAYHGWAILEQASHALEPLNGATTDQRTAASKALRGLLHDLSSARYSLDHDRRDAEEIRTQLRAIREAARVDQNS